MKIKILFFIGTLGSGGKERRLLELLTFLSPKNHYELVLVTKKSEVLFKNFFDLNVKWISLKSPKLKLGSFGEFKEIVKSEKPQIIHTWGSKQTLVALYSIIFQQKIKLVNSQITSAPPKITLMERLISRLNFHFSSAVLANSFAGINAFTPPLHKSKVIYNGLNFDRFKDLPNKNEIKKKYGLNKKFTLIMVASFSSNKDYLRFFKVGLELNKLRDDTVFLGVGYYDKENERYYQDCLELTKDYPNLKIIPGCQEIEALVNVCDLGLLFSPNGEGLSNSILEYMTLGRPVIANDAGGTKEIIQNNYNGYLVSDESPEEIAEMINKLLNDPNKMMEMGRRSEERIKSEFSLERMGQEFETVYHSLLR
ncbi:Glycosyltransferase involved in cell wall bisynthesis [Aquiflexum balticum DSM 16537]|uniref:Glycosyltransferase involved in cell wall bisynthesis n=1 Tax=Aquiflexum balticum DSM 16537 TaxID=758820 RepID=A0A1W2HBV9_9BACT|nr:glycosyltransferase [Aquiflexum balticum]SMD46291.1 Glycosyltransferase involved in cell wall bisynthesis [Aquiflexum balticum DSM 16537]